MSNIRNVGITLVAIVVFVAQLPAEILAPCLPVHCWNHGEHEMGFLCPPPHKRLFVRLIAEKTAEGDRDGFWIEKWKVDGMRKDVPEILRGYSFGEPVAIGDEVYLKVEFKGQPPAAANRDTHDAQRI